MLSQSTKNKTGFVDGSIPKPASTATDFRAWERCNDLVCSLLLCNLDDSISSNVMFFKTAREIWLDLEDRYGSTSLTQLYSLEQRLADLSQGSMSVSNFFTEIKSVWDAMNEIDPLPCCICNKCTCNVTQRVFQRQQDKRLVQFMMKLNEKFTTVRGNILIQHPPPTISNVFKLFTQEERHQNLSHSTNHTESLTFFAKPGSKPGFTSSKVNTGPPAAKKGGSTIALIAKFQATVWIDVLRSTAILLISKATKIGRQLLQCHLTMFLQTTTQSLFPCLPHSISN